MVDDPIKHQLIEARKSDMVRYSNALIKRAIEDIAARLPNLIQSISKPRRLFLIAEKDEALSICSGILQWEGFEVYLVESSAPLVDLYSELSSREYDMVVLTNSSTYPKYINEFVPEVKRRFPVIRISVISGFTSSEWEKTLKRHGVDYFFPVMTGNTDFTTWLKGLFSFERITLLISHYLPSGFLERDGFKVFVIHDPGEIEKIIKDAHIDLAIEWVQIEWKHGVRNYPILNTLKKFQKNLPIFLALSPNGYVPPDWKELGYADILKFPFDTEELKSKFLQALPARQQIILKKMPFWGR